MSLKKHLFVALSSLNSENSFLKLTEGLGIYSADNVSNIHQALDSSLRWHMSVISALGI